MKPAHLLAAVFLLALASAAWAADDLTPRLDPALCRYDPARDFAGEAAAVRTATVSLEAGQAVRERALESVGGDNLDDATDQARAAYRSEQRAALRPLALAGNAHAAYLLSRQFARDQSEFGDPKGWLTLLTCASDMGHRLAVWELMKWYWHERGDGAYATIRRNRALALDLAGREAELGSFNGIGGLGVYIGGARHLYPQNRDLGRRLLVLCARAGDDLCKENLLRGEAAGGFGLQDPVDRYLILADLAVSSPARFAARRDAIKAQLLAEQLQDATRRTDTWRHKPWSTLEPEWRALRDEIVANDSPAALACAMAKPCMLEPVPPGPAA